MLCESEILPNGSEFAYGYDETGRITAITHSTENGEENANNTAYTYGCATEVKSGNNVVRYTYDGKRRVTAVELNGVENYVTYAYEDVTVDGKKAEKVTATMKDDSTSVVIKDLNGNTLSTILGGETVNYSYDNKNRLTAISGRANGASEDFTFDALDNLSSYVYNNGSNTVSESYTYNANRQLASKTVDGMTYTYAYKDDTAKSLESVSVDGFTFSPKLDCLGRNRGKTVEANGNKLAEEQITYLKFGDHATNIPATVYYGDKKNGSYAFSDHFKYKYDSMGNITEIRENGELYAKYTYDAIGRLVREDNKKLGKTTVFTYDTNGNILCRKEYAFTLTDNLDELVSTTFAYTYDGDKLLSYNGKVCEYDIVGNPTTYRDKTATWANGRQLTSFDGNTFTYDNLGRRTGKNDVTFTYDSNGNLIKQSDGLEFFYDHTGVFAVKYNRSTYFYRKDILGNIVALLNTNGEIVATYTYDAWGNCKVFDESGNEITVETHENHIGIVNSFRYRGYYYDVETELYFLKTRYYDPETGRFITIDDISYLDPDSINGLNLYAYCRNNPVMCVDPNGCLPISLTVLGLIIGAAIGATAGGVVAYNTAKNNGATGWDLFGWTMLGIIGGGIIGGAIGAGIGAIVTKITGILGFSIIKGKIIVVKKVVVLGHAGYVALSESLGYSALEVADDFYDSMTNSQWWDFNSKFLNDCCKLGSNFIVEATRVISQQGSKLGSWLYHEIQFLLEKGYQWLEDLLALVR